jgi:hypothetical protein
MRQLFTYILSPITLFAFIAAGTLTTLAGPFGTYLSMGLIERAVYWYALIGASIIIAMPIRRYVDIVLSDHGFWPRSSCTTVLFTLIFTPFLIGVNWLLLGIQTTEFMPIWKIYLVVASVPLTVNPLVFIVLKIQREDVSETGSATLPAALTEPERPRIFERLPERLGDDLLRLSVQDHFVCVHLAEGSETLRMRFGDAISEVDGIPGLRVHRSHWVAENAVAGHEFEAGKVILTLRDGSKIPVSRNYRADVEAAGLLASAAAVVSLQQGRPERKSA